MSHPDYDLPFYWYIDRSKQYGYGIGVYQDDPSSKHPANS